MTFKYLDLFSTQFQFNVGQRQNSKRSNIGAFLSIIVISLSIAYFIYLLFLYLGNQIDPKYKSQTFISDESIKIEYHNDFVGFRFEYDANKSIEELEKQTGKTYITFVSFLEIVTPNGLKNINLDVIKCQSESLKGYNCLDLSKVPTETLENNNLENIYKQIVILVYRCADTDVYKSEIPDNCANDQEIKTMLENVESRLRIKMFTSQYNMVTEQIETSYKNIIQYVLPDEFLLSTFKTVKQITKIKKGPFIQQQTGFSSPIDYISEPRIFNRQVNIDQLHLTMQIYVRINVSEQYQQIQIQYPTFMEILTICNSTFAMIMGVGIIGRYFAKQLIKEDISLLLLQNIYQSQYLSYLKKFNITQNKIQEQEISNERKTEDVIENTQSVFIPAFLAKSKENVETNKMNQQNSPNDFIIESSKIKQCSPQQNFTIKDSEETTIDDSEFNSERFKLNILSPNKNSTNIPLSNKQLKTKDQQSKYKEPFQLNMQTMKFQQDTQQFQQNQTDIFDQSNTKDNLKQLKFDSNQKGLKLNLKNQKNQLTYQLNQIKQNKVQNRQQNITNTWLDNLKAIQDISIGDTVKNLLFGSKQHYLILFFKSLIIQQTLLIRRCISTPQTMSVFDPVFEKTLNKQVDKNLDILQLYKDIVILKKAIMVILSKDQFAAIQFIGCSGTHQAQQINSQDEINTASNSKLFIKVIIIVIIKYYKQNQDFKTSDNYLDEQFMISQSFQNQIENINVFLQRWQNNQDLSEIDQRIYSSLTQP